jgi:hypothetical protein
VTEQTPCIVDLSELCGLRWLDARGEFVGAREDKYDDAPRVVILRLDGTLYWFQEDPSDGYRSSLSHVRVALPDDLPAGCLAAFTARLVSCAVRTKSFDERFHDPERRDEVLIGIDEATGSVLFEIGTEHVDDYYPSFISYWMPPEAL